MKIAGYIFIALATLNLLAAILAFSNVSTAQFGPSKLGGAFMTGVIGAYLLHRADAKEKEKQDRDKWMNGNS
jgi:hypothetical protein